MPKHQSYEEKGKNLHSSVYDKLPIVRYGTGYQRECGDKEERIHSEICCGNQKPFSRTDYRSVTEYRYPAVVQ